MIDIQNGLETRGVCIKHVGIREFVMPIVVDINGRHVHTTATINLNVSLDADKKAIHMSRLIEMLSEWDGNTSYTTLKELLSITKNKLQTGNANIILHFLYFKEKKAPISQKSSIMNYKCTINMNDADDFFIIEVHVPISSACPCSKAISKYGAHNQRGILSIIVKTNTIASIDDLIQKAESSCSHELFSLLKRVDEKFITESTYENPKFVEDIARDMALLLSKSNGYEWFKIDVENFESIHNHSAFAVVNNSENNNGGGGQYGY